MICAIYSQPPTSAATFVCAWRKGDAYSITVYTYIYIYTYYILHPMIINNNTITIRRYVMSAQDVHTYTVHIAALLINL